MKRSSVRLRAIVAGLLTVVAVSASQEIQSGQGVIVGIVTDAVTRAPIAGALVTVSPTGLTRLVIPRESPVTTGANGRYEVPVPPGTYTVSVSSASYATPPVTTVRVSSQTITSCDFRQSPLKRDVVTPPVPPSVPGLVDIVHIFASTADGEAPGTLIQAMDGDLYGAAPLNGDLSHGTTFKMTLAGGFTPLHQFAGGADGAGPFGPLIQATDGDFYGTTSGGGSGDFGTIYRMTSAGDVTVLHSFAGGVQGSSPFGALVQGADGDFYGTASGGASDRGTVFKMTPDGIVTVLHSFSGRDDGAYPNGGLVQAADGNFYGTTYTGGSSDRGTAFRMTPDGTVTVLHSFTGGSDGTHPLVPLIQASDGNLYGTTWLGGNADGGTIFRMTAAGDVTILYSFPYAEFPSQLLQAADGNLYGTTYGDYIYAGGSIFRLTPAGAFTILHTFEWIGTTGPSGPCGGLVQATDGHLYGTTCYGGIPHQPGRGTIFRLRMPPPATAHRNRNQIKAARVVPPFQCCQL